MPITFGQASAPSQITTNLDAVFSTSLMNYRKTLTDNIGATNAFFYEIMKSGSYESADGGTALAEDLMYAIGVADSYDGYDELSSLPMDGITQSIFEWRQQACPISYSMTEVIKNQQRLVSLVKSKITQAEMGIKESWAQAFMWGAQPQGGAITSPRVSPVNGSLNIEPLPKLISYNTTTLTVGNIPETSNTWWRNHFTTSAATTYGGFMLELESMYNTVGLGTGGAADLMLMDQVTYQLFIHAYFSIYKANPDALDNGYPFVGKKFLNAKVIMDDKVPDAFTGAPGTLVGGSVDSTTMTWGTCYFINTKFFKIRYAPGRDWEMLTDEQGKTFAKPINGDSRLGHIAWMGNVTINNRRKQGVLAKIARTLA